MASVLKHDTVSKGCYYVKPRRKEEKQPLQLDNLFVPLIGNQEPLEWVNLRKKLCKSVMQELSSVVHQATSESNAKVIQQLTEHALKSNPEGQKLKAAILCDGSRNTFHLRFFEQLKLKLYQLGLKRFVVLDLKNHRDLKSCFRQIKGGSLGLGILSYDMEELGESITLVLQNVEDCDRRLLNALMEALNMISQKSKDHHVYLIFNLKVPLELFDASLDSVFFSHVQPEVFNMKATTDILESIFTLVEENLSLKFGWRTRKLFRSMFYERSWSVEKVVGCLRYGILTHFYGNALSPLPYLIQNNQTGAVSTFYVSILRTVPSFQHRIEQMLREMGTSGKKIIQDLLENDDVFLEYIKSTFQELARRESFLRKHVKCWQELETHMSRPTKLAFGEYMEVFLEGLWFESEQYETFRKDILRLNSHQALACMEHLNKHMFSGPRVGKGLNLADELEHLVDSSKNKYLETVEMRMKNYSGTEHTRKVMETGFDKSILRYSRWLKELVQLLDEEIEHGMLGTQGMDAYPFYEVFFFDYRRPLEQGFLSGHQRSVIHSSCMNPEYYIGMQRISDTEEKNEANLKQNKPWLPDLSILYKLYSESGAFLNLYDWYMAFSENLQVLATEERLPTKRRFTEESEADLPKDEMNAKPDRQYVPMEVDENSNKESVELQSRFLFGLEELRFLGLIKPTTRKTDHVMKTIYHH
ncbi:origin recognition complex subunit Orp3 [Schizosaccharomyces cryophilus OY26]|uniref:Origin recognition complex subunit Orp3 n=1 Tax=Schizosaccharomyces cryophilus (strain OY26 / ATCC MYA-4695 / CBS 11777 / NBRC 106824 / NRRL Y48691) TaxID=653667 RepID=S9XGR2_SCHCR|nr:origin recognition complex subunit Orp3 [Schizosaccharomyces cryophilus OY26]EPY52826.1 origin recognition complex subunit Orp3 [Schizosaccharomyces cryophilus OY26]